MLGLMLLGAGLFAAPAAAQEAPAGPEVYALRHANAADLKPALESVLSVFGDAVEVQIDNAGNRLLVRGPGKAQQLARELIGRLDLPAGDPRGGQADLRTYAVQTEDLKDYAQ